MSDASVRKGIILVIEDEPGYRLIYKTVLEGDGYQVLEAEDGDQGWELAQSQHPDLILLDLALPKVNGVEILKKIRKEPSTRDIPVIIFSSFGEQKHIKGGLALGASDYTIKGSHSPREVLGKIQKLLTRAGAQKPVAAYRLAIRGDAGDAGKLAQDSGLSKLLQCRQCNTALFLELVPDSTRTDGHWFTAHFVCPICKRSF